MTRFADTTLAGDRAYSDKDFLAMVEKADLGFLNTVKHGPSLLYKYGSTGYKTTIKQIDVLEKGPVRWCVGELGRTNFSVQRVATWLLSTRDAEFGASILNDYRLACINHGDLEGRFVH